MNVSAIWENSKKENRRILTEIESKAILTNTNIICNKTYSAKSKAEAVRLSQAIGYPVVLKVSSTEIIHKSDVGGVKVNLSNQSSVESAYEEILASCNAHFPNTRIEGVSVQAMIKSGVELIMGAFTDKNFGPIIMFGLGGIFVEIFDDVSFRIVPVDSRNANEMINEIKGKKLLYGFRGMAPVNINLISEMLVNLSSLVQKNSEIMEVDLNPVFANKDSVIVADARIVTSH